MAEDLPIDAMPDTDPRIDAYITKAAPFAQPILMHFRALVRRALPEMEEGIKWGMPAFMVGGKNVAGMAAFKAHCAVMIHGEGRTGDHSGMGGYGKVAALADLPDDAALEAAVQAAARRVAESGKAERPKASKSAKAAISMPEDFAVALAANLAAQATLAGFPPFARREYLEWIITAKQAATRARRIAQAVEWLAEGKKRNWKYERC